MPFDQANLEERLIMGDCVWYYIMHDEASTTREGAMEGNTSLMRCQRCTGQLYDCRDYRSQEYLLRRAKQHGIP